MQGRDSIRQAFEAYSDELFRHCLVRLSDRERALELTQECFLKVLQYVERGKEVQDMRPFLYQTLRHLIIDEYRKHKNVSLEALAESAEREVDDFLPPAEDNVLEAAIGRFDGARALAALWGLPEPYREAVALRYLDGFSPKEIAVLIGESENAASVRVHRGLKKLRAMLEADSGFRI